MGFTIWMSKNGETWEPLPVENGDEVEKWGEGTCWAKEYVSQNDAELDAWDMLDRNGYRFAQIKNREGDVVSEFWS